MMMEVDEQAPSVIQRKFEKAQSLKESNCEEAIKLFKEIISTEEEVTSDADLKLQEQSIYGLGDIYVEKCRVDDVKALLRELRPFFAKLPKARTAKIVRTLIDSVERLPSTSERGVSSLGVQIELASDCIQWCTEEKRTFLRLRVETRLAALYFRQQKYALSLDVLTGLVREVKKLDDKLLLVEIYLVESKVHYAVKNIAKAKASLTASRTNANAIHCPPLLQAEIDLQSGVLHAHEGDYKTSFSYFFEAFEAFNVADDARALTAMKYMLLAKIMNNHSEEVAGITSAKSGMKYQGLDIDALKAVAKCHLSRSLKLFEVTLQQYQPQLQDDPIIGHHINDLNESLLEQNLLRILEPFSRVEISHIAKLIDLPIDRVQKKLCDMILDKKLLATLDQGAGILVLFDTPPQTQTYEHALGSVQNISQVVDTLYAKAQMLLV